MNIITRNQVNVDVSTIGTCLVDYANANLVGDRQISLSGDLCFSNNEDAMFVYERSHGALTRDEINHPFHTQSWFTKLQRDGSKTTVPMKSSGLFDWGKIRLVESDIWGADYKRVCYQNTYSIAEFPLSVVRGVQFITYRKVWEAPDFRTLWTLDCVGDLNVEIH